MAVNPEVSPTSRGRRALAVTAIAGFASAFTLLRGQWPEVFTFATDPNASLLSRLLSAPVHLADDVMITVRSGEMVLQTGMPDFNASDSAQAATSYLAPYLFALLRLVLPFNAAVVAFAVLGFAAVVGTYVVIAARARSLINGAILVAALALTVTNLEFALTGWDHLIQGLVFAIAAALVLRPPESITNKPLVAISILAAIGSIMRPDGLIIAGAILLLALMRSAPGWRRAWIPTLVPFAVIAGVTLVVNFLQFGHLTPTTARLKAGAAPSLTYMRDYLWANGIESYTAASLLVILALVTLLMWRRIPLLPVGLLVLAALVTAGVAAVNSDFFPGARMFWVPAVVMATSLAVTMPGILRAGPAFKLTEDGSIETRWSPRAEWAIVIVLVGACVVASAALGLRGAVVSTEALPGSRTAQQFLATQWIKENLDPADGSVGVFYAGEAAHLPEFEAADFLGKADEEIAALPPQWGPPGHNKWDIDLTLEKWRPQIILSTIDQDPNDPSADALAEEWRANRWTHGYLADLITDDVIREEYSYCRVPDPSGRMDVSVDVLLRRDLLVRPKVRGVCAP
jgi:hypothetical protein